MKGVKGVGDTFRGVSPTNTDLLSQPPTSSHITPLPDSPTNGDLAAAVGAAALPVPHKLLSCSALETPLTPLSWEYDALLSTPTPENLHLLSPEVPEEGSRFVSEKALPPPGTGRSLPSSPLVESVESMDSTPGSAKRFRPMDSPAKGQPKSKI
jgi:hypothetical protein